MTPADNTMAPELSIIIPTYNRAELLRRCLESLFRQTEPFANFEVIVVVDGSVDGTREMLANLATPYGLHVVWQEHEGQAAALNRGVVAAAGQFCLFLDDDITTDPRLVGEHLRAQRTHEGVVGIGYLECLLPPNANGFVQYFTEGWREMNARLAQDLRSLSAMDCYSGNLSAPRRAVLAAGSFAVELRQRLDVDLGYRLKCQGLPLVYIRDAIGRQHYRKGFREVVVDAEGDGAADVELWRRYPDLLPHMQLGEFGERRLVFVLLLRLLLTIRAPIRPIAAMGPLLGRGRSTRRWYSLVQRYCYWRGVRRAVPDRDTWRQLTQGPVFLAYHAVGNPGEPGSPYVVPERRFVRQMGWLNRRGYIVISLGEFLRFRYEHRLPPARSVVITFDDGYADTLTVAHPILRKHGFPATIFLVTGAVGSANRWDREGDLTGRPLLSWADIQAMTRDGISFAAHTRSHASLTLTATDEARKEMDGSWADLERELEDPLPVLAYPYGEVDMTCRMLAEEVGFRAACGVRPGINSPATSLYDLRRVEIFGTDALMRFALAVWLGISQVPDRRKGVRHLCRRAISRGLQRARMMRLIGPRARCSRERADDQDMHV